MSRSFGGTSLTTRSPMRMSPDVMFSSPAIMRSSVDLPQPDGPTSTTNSPSRIAMSMPWMTAVAPKAFRTSLIATEAIHSSPLARREILYFGLLALRSAATNSASRAARNNGSATM